MTPPMVVIPGLGAGVHGLLGDPSDMMYRRFHPIAQMICVALREPKQSDARIRLRPRSLQRTPCLGSRIQASLNWRQRLGRGGPYLAPPEGPSPLRRGAPYVGMGSVWSLTPLAAPPGDYHYHRHDQEHHQRKRADPSAS